jgi:hypothetical protein
MSYQIFTLVSLYSKKFTWTNALAYFVRGDEEKLCSMDSSLKLFRYFFKLRGRISITLFLCNL